MDAAGRVSATCSDYSNQAAAQRAKDTRDTDHDGIYCEDLPCPCSAAWYAQHGGDGGGNPTPTPRPKPKPKRPRVGPPVAFGKRTRGSGCTLRGALPDPRCTPGSVFRDATPRLFCKSGYTDLIRHVTDATQRKVYAEYGITSHPAGRYEIDHLVPLELRGSNSISNLFPETVRPRPGAHDKNRLEDETHDPRLRGTRQLPQLAAADRI